MARNLTDVDVDTFVVPIVNPTVVAPAGTVTLPGIVAHTLLEDMKTMNPPGPAGPFNVTEPDTELPPVIVEGETLSDTSSAGVTVSWAIFADAL